MAESAVLGLPDRRCGEVPVLARVAQTGVEIDLAALRAHLALRLGRFKQPRRIVLLAALPRTALGEVQKAALRQALLRQAVLRQALLDADNFLSPVD